MSMERWNPFRDMDVMRQAMDRWFDDRVGNYFTGNTGSSQVASVAVDVHETENGYELTASLPGVRPEDVDVTINRDTITLRGRSEQTTQRQQGNYIYRERHSGTFQRTIRLPEPISADQTEATLENGVLKLTLPRLQQTPNHKVQIRAGSNSGAQSLNTQSSTTSQSTSNTQSWGSSQRQGNAGTSSINQGGTSQSGTATASQSGTENVPVRTTMSAGIDSPGAATTTLGGNISRDIGDDESISQRPSVLQGLGSNEMSSLETHIVSNDHDGFMRLAGSYGWDQQTCQQVWDFMTHNPSGSEASNAFGSQQQGNSAQM